VWNGSIIDKKLIGTNLEEKIEMLPQYYPSGTEENCGKRQRG
jgi:hypothetical protein